MSAQKLHAFFASADPWGDELRALRAILRDTDLTEDWKWRAPCYTAHGGNIAILWNFKPHCSVGFFKGVLLDDPQGHLQAPGDNSRSARVMAFRTMAEIAAGETALRAFVDAAIANEKAGLKVDFPQDEMALPDELSDRLSADPALAKAWDALTPGRRRGYVLQIGSAKRAETRAARVEKHIARILAGKGLHDR